MLALAAIVLCTPGGLFAKKEKARDASAPFAMIAGTVYRPPGFAMPGAEVIITPEATESGGGKVKKVETVTDARGEWVVRVPPVPAKWRVDVKIKGYRPEQRSVSVTGEQRIDLSIILEPARQPQEATQ